MFCPVCRDEFVTGIEACPDCGAGLVDALVEDDLPESGYVELVTVFQGNMSEVIVAKSLLHDAGIRFFAKGEHLQQLYGLGNVGNVQLQVAERDAEQARQILAGLHNRT